MSVRIKGKLYIDTEQAANVLGKTPRMVRVYIERGQLKGKRVGDTWLVSHDSLNVLLGAGSGGEARNGATPQAG